MSIFGADQLETLIPKLLKWLEVRQRVSSLRVFSFLTSPALRSSFLHQVRSAGESGILAFIIKDGNPLIMYGAVHNGPVEEGQQRINDIVESEFALFTRLLSSFLAVPSADYPHRPSQRR